jgi:hypothetical protein
MSAETIDAMDEILSRQAITDMLYRWCRGVDRKDWPLVRSVFHSDGYDDHGVYRGNIEGLIAFLEERHQTISQSQHIVTNILIEFAGANLAAVESYVTAFQQLDMDGASRRLMVQGRYIDKVARRDGVWRIERRTCIMEASSEEPVQPAGVAKASWTLQRRDAGDAVYVLRNALGIA